MTTYQIHGWDEIGCEGFDEEVDVADGLKGLALAKAINAAMEAKNECEPDTYRVTHHYEQHGNLVICTAEIHGELSVLIARKA